MTETKKKDRWCNRTRVFRSYFAGSTLSAQHGASRLCNIYSTNAGILPRRAGDSFSFVVQTDLIMGTRLPFAYIIHGLVRLIFFLHVIMSTRTLSTRFFSVSLFLFLSLLPSLPSHGSFKEQKSRIIYWSLNNYKIIHVFQVNVT